MTISAEKSIQSSKYRKKTTPEGIWIMLNFCITVVHWSRKNSDYLNKYSWEYFARSAIFVGRCLILKIDEMDHGRFCSSFLHLPGRKLIFSIFACIEACNLFTPFTWIKPIEFFYVTFCWNAEIFIRNWLLYRVAKALKNI